VADLFDLIHHQLGNWETFNGTTWNVGGGRDVSVSLCELTRICEDATGKRLQIASDPETRPADIPLYLSDCRRVSQVADWSPKRTVPEIIEEITRWIRENETALRPILS
jgi:CDP-paratose 2-epimerase